MRHPPTSARVLVLNDSTARHFLRCRARCWAHSTLRRTSGGTMQIGTRPRPGLMLRHPRRGGMRVRGRGVRCGRRRRRRQRCAMRRRAGAPRTRHGLMNSARHVMKRIWDPRFPSVMTSYDVASITHQSLRLGGAAGRTASGTGDAAIGRVRGDARLPFPGGRRACRGA